MQCSIFCHLPKLMDLTDYKNLFFIQDYCPKLRTDSSLLLKFLFVLAISDGSGAHLEISLQIAMCKDGFAN